MIRPLFISKVNTTLQIVLVAVVMLQAGFGLALWGAAQPLIWLVTATTLASGGAYVWVAARGH
jgi:cardiolipin synthase